jgi:predicted metal-dependent hydrolase
MPNDFQPSLWAERASPVGSECDFGEFNQSQLTETDTKSSRDLDTAVNDTALDDDAFDDDGVDNDDIVESDSDESDIHDGDIDHELPGEDFVFVATDFSSVEIRRSPRRKRTVTAYRENGKTVVVAPQRMSARDVDSYARELVGRLDARERRNSSGPALYARAQRLVAEFLEHDVLANRDVDIRWVTNQSGRWGSCTPRQGRIRLSHRLMDMPDYVIDSVLLHELAHLIVSNHGPRFQTLVSAYPDLARADAYLAGYSLALQKGNF